MGVVESVMEWNITAVFQNSENFFNIRIQTRSNIFERNLVKSSHKFNIIEYLIFGTGRGDSYGEIATLINKKIETIKVINFDTAQIWNSHTNVYEFPNFRIKLVNIYLYPNASLVEKVSTMY